MPKGGRMQVANVLHEIASAQDLDAESPTGLDDLRLTGALTPDVSRPDSDLNLAIHPAESSGIHLQGKVAKSLATGMLAYFNEIRATEVNNALGADGGFVGARAYEEVVGFPKFEAWIRGWRAEWDAFPLDNPINLRNLQAKFNQLFHNAGDQPDLAEPDPVDAREALGETNRRDWAKEFAAVRGFRLIRRPSGKRAMMVNLESGLLAYLTVRDPEVT